MAAASRTLVRLAGETELHRTPLEGVLSPVARFRGPSRVPNSEAVRRLLVRLHEFPHPRSGKRDSETAVKYELWHLLVAL